MEIIHQIMRLKGNHLELNLPDRFSDKEVVVSVSVFQNNGEKHGFSRFAGTLSREGDPVAEQRRLRDEW